MIITDLSNPNNCTPVIDSDAAINNEIATLTHQVASVQLGELPAAPSEELSIHMAPRVLKTLPNTPKLQIVNPKKYNITEGCLRAATNLSRDSDLHRIWECCNHFSGNDPDSHARLALRNGQPAAVVLGSTSAKQPNVFNLDILCVAPEERGYKGLPSADRVGMNAVFDAMRKAQKLGKRFVQLTYDPGYGCLTNYSCKRRDAFYHKFDNRFGITAYFEDEEFYDDDDGYYRIRTATYDLIDFDYQKAMIQLATLRRPRLIADGTDD